MARGCIALDQIQDVNRQGDGSRFATTDGSYTAGNVPMYDSTGKLINSSVAAVGTGGATPILDSSGNPIFDASGNWIY
jgi:hypothetical protein